MRVIVVSVSAFVCANTFSATVRMASEVYVNNKIEFVSNYVNSVANRVDSIIDGISQKDATVRLISPDGETYQDATGVVWKAEYSTRLSDDWIVKRITYTDDQSVLTNEIPNMPSW